MAKTKDNCIMIELRPNHRLMSIQALRGFAIMLIVMSHVVGHVFDFGGESGVCFFFVMSGFVLSMANEEKLATGQFATKRFLVRQLRKFYPLLLLSVLFFVLAYRHAGYPIDYDRLMTNLLLIQTWFCSEHLVFSYVESSWFLCDILVFYLFFKPLNRLVMDIGVKTLILTCVIVMAIYLTFVVWIPSERFNYTLYSFPIFRLIDCCLGIILFRFVISEYGKRLSGKICMKAIVWQCLLLLLLLSAFCLAYFVYRDMLPVNFRGVCFFWPFVILFMLLTMAIERSRPSFFSMPVIKALVYLGDISMEIFLTHEMAIYVVNVVMDHYGLYATHPLMVYTFYTIAIILFAWLARQGLTRLSARRARH